MVGGLDYHADPFRRFASTAHSSHSNPSHSTEAKRDTQIERRRHKLKAKRVNEEARKCLAEAPQADRTLYDHSSFAKKRAMGGRALHEARRAPRECSQLEFLRT